MVKLTLKMDNITKDVKPGTGLMAFCEEVGSSIAFGCGTGVCGVCLVQVVSGMENLSKPTEQESESLKMLGAKKGQRLACQITIQGPGEVVIDSLD